MSAPGRSEAPAPRVVRVADVAPQRWRNGGGFTRELLALPATDAWRLRVSVADIESDGPFSAFAGIARHFAVLQGKGVVLTIDGRETTLRAGDPAVAFDGAATTTCRLLDGPTRDLNLMVRGAGGTMGAVTPGASWSPRAPACGLFTTAAGTCRAGATQRPLEVFTLAWFDHAPAALAFEATGWWLTP